MSRKPSTSRQKRDAEVAKIEWATQMLKKITETPWHDAPVFEEAWTQTLLAAQHNWRTQQRPRELSLGDLAGGIHIRGRPDFEFVQALQDTRFASLLSTAGGSAAFRNVVSNRGSEDALNVQTAFELIFYDVNFWGSLPKLAAELKNARQEGSVTIAALAPVVGTLNEWLDGIEARIGSADVEAELRKCNSVPKNEADWKSTLELGRLNALNKLKELRALTAALLA